MNSQGKEDTSLTELRQQLKALSNRYAVDILRVLNPGPGEMIPNLSWDNIFDGILKLDRIKKPKIGRPGEKTPAQIKYEQKRKSLVSGGTIYETMNKLIRAGFVSAAGSKGKKNREFRITQQGRQALTSIGGMLGPTSVDTDVQKAAKILLKHKNFVSLLPAQEKFVREIGSVDGNLIIQMPPGSGKTFLAMIIILLKLQNKTRCLYITPYTSLNRQIIDEYGSLFRELGYSVVRNDGQHRASVENLETADLVVSVFESYMSAQIRRRKWTKEIGLVVVDELTELESSGPIRQARNIGTDRSTKLDCVISLLKDKVQMVTLSSRFGDTELVADWLNASVFRPSFRLTPEEFIVRLREDAVDIYSSDGTQNTVIKAENATEAILKHIDDTTKSILFVMGSRFEAEALANRLAEEYPRPIQEEVVSSIVGHEASLPVTQLLEKTLRSGVAFHHSGLAPSVRERLERRIRQGIVRMVASTTGITAGMSFPFDSVVIYFDYTLYYIAARARYLQIAGRIGEYHLSKYGGSVYLVFIAPRQFQDAETMEEVLLHQPLEPLYPGEFYPSLVANLIMTNAVTKRTIDRQELKTAFMDIIRKSLRNYMDDEYEKRMASMFKVIFDWVVKEKILVKKDEKYALNMEVNAALGSGISIIDYSKVKDALSAAKEDSSDEELVELLMQFELPQSIRPRSVMPAKIEVKASNLESPDEWYIELSKQRTNVKKQVLLDWIGENGVRQVLENAEKLSESIQVGGRPMGGVDLGEGDLEYFVEVCSNLATDLSAYYNGIKKKGIAKRFNQLSRQIRFGVKRDLAESDLLDLEVVIDKDLPPKLLSREEIRILFENGYLDVNLVVRKEIDPNKEGLARDRFAQKSGLDGGYAKSIYRAALQHLHEK